MNSLNRKHHRNPNIKSTSPSAHSRSRDKELQINNNNYSNESYNPEDGKLYLSNIPIIYPQYKITEEFGKYGRIIDFSFRKKTDIANPYYYGYITFSSKSEAEEAMKNIINKFNWTVMPFCKNPKENKGKNMNNINRININHIDRNNMDGNINYDNYDSYNNCSNIKIREILVENLPPWTNEKDLYIKFFIYGEISKIELKSFGDKKNAFIKFRLVSSAMKALENGNNTNYNGNIIKISFSDFRQRKDVIGDEIGYELNEDNCKLIVICLNKNAESTNEENAADIFGNFGKIKNLCILNINNRNHIFVEYYKYEDAKKAIREMNKDINEEKRDILGDKNCTIDFYYKNILNEINPIFPPINNINENSIQNNMNTNNNKVEFFKNMILQNLALRMGLGGLNPSFLCQLPQNNLPNNQFNFNKLNNCLNIQSQNNNLNNQFQNNDINNNLFLDNNNKPNNNLLNINNFNTSNPLNNLLNSLSSKIALNTMPQTLYPNFSGIKIPQNTQNFENCLSQDKNDNKISLSLYMNNPSISNIINNNFKNQINLASNNINNKINSNENETENDDVKDLICNIMKNKNNEKKSNNCDSDISSQSSEQMDFEKEYSLEEENLKYIWNGYLTKNRKDKVSVDLYKVRGKIDDSYFNELYLNVCNRIQYEEVLKKQLLGIAVISPQNITQKECFDKYLNYLHERQRCGVIILSDKYTLYIVSPGEFSKKFYINPKKHLLGLLIDSTVPPNLNVDINNLNLPPPVISMNEKRRLLNENKKKKNEDKKETSKINQNNIDLIMTINKFLKKNEKNNIKRNQNVKEIEKINKKNEL